LDTNLHFIKVYIKFGFFKVFNIPFISSFSIRIRYKFFLGLVEFLSLHVGFGESCNQFFIGDTSPILLGLRKDWRKDCL